MGQHRNCCCRTPATIGHPGQQVNEAGRRTSFWNRVGKAMGWILPSTALALMPKCPACFAAYFAAATGLGISYSVASHLRVLSIAVCAAVLLGMFAGVVMLLRNHPKVESKCE
ncbi:hypothetical protein K2Y11_09335 [bacterium]|nr:hypothetical protein [bacterium]